MESKNYNKLNSNEKSSKDEKSIKICYDLRTILQSKDKKEKEKEKSKLAFSSLIRFLKGSLKEKFLVSITFFSLMMQTLTTIANPYLGGLLIDSIKSINNQKSNEINKLGIIFLCVFTLSSFFFALSKYLIRILSEKVGNNLKKEIFSNLLNFDIEFFDSRKTGDLMSKICSDATKLSNLNRHMYNGILRGLALLISTFVVMIIINPHLGSIIIVLFPIHLIITTIVSKYSITLAKQNREYNGYSNVILEESISNIRIIKSFTAEDKEFYHYSNFIEKSYYVKI